MLIVNHRLGFMEYLLYFQLVVTLSGVTNAGHLDISRKQSVVNDLDKGMLLFRTITMYLITRLMITYRGQYPVFFNHINHIICRIIKL